MSPNSTTMSLNVTSGRPLFYINGFSNMLYANYYFMFLSVVYVLTILANAFIMIIICIERSLHNPKYVAVFHLAVVDTCCSTVVIPFLIHTFIFSSQFIVFEACLANMFFVHFFNGLQSVSLVLLAYDRVIAICFPLHYHTVNTNITMIIIIVVVWVFFSVMFLVMVLLITRLSFCKSTVIDSYFCDHGPVYKLACNDTSVNYIFAVFLISLFLILPMLIIVLSYACILFQLFKMTSTEGRRKALKTCTSHLILVAILFIPILVTYIAAIVSAIHPNARILNNSLSATIPPLLNPIIYTLKTEEIMEAIKKVLKRNKIFQVKS
ncbi:olfactory receptor 1509-like [Polyodon spathula]|uniref:olfactory receptor 1509-like n=1 Tax=Polyodon spathula TaxID=7913 RepID=UPI001B7E8C0E|nr:olfactory receptor 1509-like [Polyodon spathula]XP_041116143.1 olfactory receptor 1509-like [Polyodon spathula]